MTIADDRRAVTDLLLDYAELVDAADLDGVVGLFTADATLDYGFGRTVTGTRRCAPSTATALRHLPGDQPPHLERPGRRRRRPGDGAATSTPGTSAGGTQAEAWGRYLDDLVRTADGWRIARAPSAPPVSGASRP